MKTDINGFLSEITALRDSYVTAGNKGGARVAQQVLTLSEIYSKYDFPAVEFYGHLQDRLNGFAKIYEKYETEERDANPVILEVIQAYKG